MVWFIWLACTSEDIQYTDFTTRDTDIVSEPTSEPSEETGDTETDDTSEEITVDEYLTFRSPLMSCSELQLRTMTLTRVFPDGLNSQGESEAEFYGEILRQSLSDPSIVYTSTDGVDDCIFFLGVANPDNTDLQEVVLLDEGEEVEIGVQWAFYYPATFVHQEVFCEPLKSPLPIPARLDAP